MPGPAKIATCCYCGTKAALVLTGETRHELSCRSCGAPLHDLKKLRVDKPGSDAKTGKVSHLGAKLAKPGPKPKKAKKRKKARKGLWERIVDEAIDAIEDVFD